MATRSRTRDYFAPYHFLVTLPDRLYPWGCEIQGQWVLGIRSYDRALARAYRKYGRGHYGYGLSWYRQCFHLAGSLILISIAALIASGSILVIAILGIAYQEFILQRRTYRQLWRKGVMDWFVWCAPMGVYLLLIH